MMQNTLRLKLEKSKYVQAQKAIQRFMQWSLSHVSIHSDELTGGCCFAHRGLPSPLAELSW